MDSHAEQSNHSIVENQSEIRVNLNALPAEMFLAILSRLSVANLIRLRTVSKQWMVVIESFCRHKKCLVTIHSSHKEYLSQLSQRFNGNFKLNKHFVVIQLKFHSIDDEFHKSDKRCTLLAKLFPRIEKLFTNVGFVYSSREFRSMFQQWSSTLTFLSLYKFPWNFEHLCAQINQLASLRQLDVYSNIVDIAQQLKPTFGRLEHISTCSNIVEIVPFLGERITSLGICLSIASLDEMIKFRDLYAGEVSRIVRFSSHTIRVPQVVSFICDHFASLKMLNFVANFKLTTNMIAHLAQLVHLTELRIESIFIDLPTLGVSKCLTPLGQIEILSFVDFHLANCQGLLKCLPENFVIHNFTQVLSSIFPNVQKLTLKSYRYNELANLLETHVKAFVNLRSYDFGLKVEC